MRQHFFFPFVSVYDQMLDLEACNTLIEWFENHEELQSRTYLENQRDFTEINLLNMGASTIQYKGRSIVEYLLDVFDNCLYCYMQEYDLGHVHIPKDWGYEAFRMKRYLPNTGEQFQFHTDVGDYASARRFISFLWYLNSPFEGGETIFKFRKDDPPIITIKPLAGRVLMFPPLWTYPHAGLPVISGPKFILTSYAHYL